VDQGKTDKEGSVFPREERKAKERRAARAAFHHTIAALDQMLRYTLDIDDIT
jgi:hypothetical protein